MRMNLRVADENIDLLAGQIWIRSIECSTSITLFAPKLRNIP